MTAARTVNLTHDAFALVAGLVRPTTGKDAIDHSCILAPDATWAEVRNSFPPGVFDHAAKDPDSLVEYDPEFDT